MLHRSKFIMLIGTISVTESPDSEPKVAFYLHGERKKRNKKRIIEEIIMMGTSLKKPSVALSFQTMVRSAGGPCW